MLQARAQNRHQSDKRGHRETHGFQSCENDRQAPDYVKAVCTTLLPNRAIALGSWDLQCPCPSTEHCPAQEAMGTYIS